MVTAGIDLAKNIFAVNGVDENGKAVLIKPKVARDQLLPLIVQMPACMIGMEARSEPLYSRQMLRFTMSFNSSKLHNC